MPRQPTNRTLEVRYVLPRERVWRPQDQAVIQRRTACHISDPRQCAKDRRPQLAGAVSASILAKRIGRVQFLAGQNYQTAPGGCGLKSTNTPSPLSFLHTTTHSSLSL
ncbi:unnamed protein product [Linum trigynum]|uniref:Uncharacterized protein n=1 Tax=Linum trigynum TaxID=586398 RepID=A0AAV2F483_9ROSI